VVIDSTFEQSKNAISITISKGLSQNKGSTVAWLSCNKFDRIKGTSMYIAYSADKQPTGIARVSSNTFAECAYCICAGDSSVVTHVLRNSICDSNCGMFFSASVALLEDNEITNTGMV